VYGQTSLEGSQIVGEHEAVDVADTVPSKAFSRGTSLIRVASATAASKSSSEGSNGSS